MPEPDKENQWSRLVDAARDAGATTREEQHDAAPSTFISRVITLREGLWKFARTVLWRRWSLVAALLALLLYLTFFLILRSTSPSSVPSPAPLSLPQPPDPE
ncbi:MAG: hypothetical protein CMP29_00425 [Roseibacillus sp.]|nr:hypothetical protein [Roseibacillus sp.]|tara:strand:- start:172 stop:477 length:306 start_codon:yes stop_codon:yes gene_type:complete